MDLVLDPNFETLLEDPDFLMGPDLLPDFDPLPHSSAPVPSDDNPALADDIDMFPDYNLADDDTHMADDSDSIHGKQDIVYFACGHARASDIFGELIESDVHTWSGFDELSSQANYTFTNTDCGHRICREHSRDRSRFNGDNVVRAQYVVIDPLDLQSRYAKYHTEITDIGTRLASVHSDCLLTVWAIDVPVLRRLFKLFPSCFTGDSTIDVTTLDNGDIQTLLTRIYNEDNPYYAVQIMCRLASRKLADLVDDLRFFNFYLDRLAELQNRMWGNGCLSVYVPPTDQELPLHMTVRSEMAEEHFGPDIADDGASKAYPWWDQFNDGARTHELPAPDFSPLRPYDIGGSNFKSTFASAQIKRAKEEISPITKPLRSLRDMVKAGWTSCVPHFTFGTTEQVVGYSSGSLITPSTPMRNVLRTSNGTIAKRRRRDKEQALASESVFSMAPSMLKRKGIEISDDAIEKRQRRC